MDPFAVTERPLTQPDPVRAELRARGPVVRVEAPAGGPAWIVTEDALAREVLHDPRIVKDPAWAPEGWDQRTAGLEAPAAAQPSLTTADGPPHATLRRAHAPLLSARRMQQRRDRIADTARTLLHAAGPDPVDLMADFTTRYPLAVLFDLLDVPLDRMEEAVVAARAMAGGDMAGIGMFMDVAAASLAEGRTGLSVELRERVDVTEEQLCYLLFALLFAGQLTTDAVLGSLLARVLDGDRRPAGELVDDVLRTHPPAPYTLWRFTTEEVELAGVRLPARAPVLVDIEGIGTDLAFGAGPHHCIGAQLALVELRAAVDVLRSDFPDARLAVPYAELRQVGLGGVQGGRLRTLPVVLRP
jgi:cytochrome P450